MTVDWATADEAPLVQELVDRLWRKGHVLARDEALLRWQYRVPDDASRLSVLLARRARRPVGFLGVVQAPFCRRGATLRGGWLAMWAVEDDARGTQAGLALLRAALHEFDVVAVLGFNERAEAIFRRLGFEVQVPLPRLVTLSPQGEDIAGAEWSDDAAERWDRRWRDELAPRFVGTARDAAFVRWRYVEHPAYRYVVRLAPDIGSLVVHRVQETDAGRVVRFVEAIGDPAATSGLVRLALQETDNAWLADFTCVNEVHAEAFRRAGFTAEHQLGEPPDWFDPVARSPRGLGGAFYGVDPKEIYATRGDGDQDRPS